MYIYNYNNVIIIYGKNNALLYYNKYVFLYMNILYTIIL